MSGGRTYAGWIAVDWGTTHLRAWAMAEDGGVRAEAASEDGMGRLDRDGFEPALLRLIEPWLGADPVEILACGMVGSRQGWAEVPYVSVPAKPAELAPVAITARDHRLRVSVIPGLSQANPPDVMRGEETQIAGFLADHPDFDGVLCLPGTHSKWVQISAAEVVSFQTYLTGELFSLLSRDSVLRHSTGGDTIDADAFGQAVSDTLSRPETLAHSLFGIRAENVLNGPGQAAGRGRLSGLLIGAELAAARPYWLGQEVVVAGAPGISQAYSDALATQGVVARRVDAAPLTRKGLAHARATQKETAT